MVANPEAYNYQGEDALTAKRITWTPTPIEATKEPKSSDGENLPAEGDTTSKEVIMTEEEANKMVEDFLNDPETFLLEIINPSPISFAFIIGISVFCI